MNFKLTCFAVLTSLLLVGTSFAQSGSRVPSSGSPIIQNAAPVIQGSGTRMPLEGSGSRVPMAADPVISSGPIVGSTPAPIVGGPVTGGCSGCGAVAYSPAPMVSSGCSSCGGTAITTSAAADLWYGSSNYCSGSGAIVSSCCGSVGHTRRVYRPMWFSRRSSCGCGW